MVDITEYNLRESEKRIGQLYPVLKDSSGRVIDGNQRLKANPDWQAQTLPQVRTEEDRILVRIHANQQRRIVHIDERRSDLGQLAEVLKQKGVPKSQIVNRISEETGFTTQYVRELLPGEFKREYFEREGPRVEVKEPEAKERVPVREREEKRRPFCDLAPGFYRLLGRRGKFTSCEDCNIATPCQEIKELLKKYLPK